MFHQVIDREDYKFFASSWIEGRKYLDPVSAGRQEADSPQMAVARRSLLDIVRAAQRDVIPAPRPDDVPLQEDGYEPTTAASHNCPNAGIVLFVNASTGALQRLDDQITKVSICLASKTCLRRRIFSFVSYLSKPSPH
jgi:hypothetical protein